ncbi:shikimate kinase [Acetanaerobacterium elongatum]|uniref:Shikimate kinase n=1 Tax=Acetanaerobacterium elongatum TaxID=258515 RepID=A0A1G9YYJ6_9FIRM|nr:shikimate kinase [Acetanaerobacterium elongatum]
MKDNRIMLTGFMGSGKTSVATALARELNYPFLDTDKYIEEREGMSVADIFAKRGEAYFRTLEHQITFDLMKNFSAVISSGGGFILTDAVYQLAASKFNLVFLDTPFEVCLSRIKNDKSRPLAATRTDEELLKLYNYRRGIYRARSDFSVDGSKKLLSDVVDEIIHKLK